MEKEQTSPRWMAISRAAGLTITFAVLALMGVAQLTGRRYDTFTAESLLVIAAYLLGGPSLVMFWRRRNGNGSG